MKKMLCPEFMAYNMPRDKNHITHGVWNEVNIWLVLPAVLRPLNKIVPLVLLNEFRFLLIHSLNYGASHRRHVHPVALEKSQPVQCPQSTSP